MTSNQSKVSRFHASTLLSISVLFNHTLLRMRYLSILIYEIVFYLMWGGGGGPTPFYLILSTKKAKTGMR